jgi:hypothetical protein
MKDINMVSPNIVMVIATGLAALYLLRPRLMNAPLWRATMTPLASIIGSGFLVSGPILAHVAGNWAWLAMLGLCTISYLFGGAIRYNIQHAETILDGHPPRFLAALEKTSEYALALAYFVSVAYYLNLFAAFTLRADHITDPRTISWLASFVILALGLLGLFRGLRGLERIEAPAVGLKLALIFGLMAALGLWFITALSRGEFPIHRLPHDTGSYEISVLLGLVILVQGFETSRYLGNAYGRDMRIKTMRRAQIISTLIYVAFIMLISPFFATELPGTGGETAIIDMLLPLGGMVGPLIIFAALMSQFSAAVADLNGASGLMSTLSKARLSTGVGYLVVAVAATAITWTGNIYTIIAYASKAFAIYYALQCAVAVLMAYKRQDYGRACLFALGIFIALAVIVFGISAEG